MDLQEQIGFFERNRDWQGLVEELERGLSGSSQNAIKASIHLKLGRVLETKFLQSVKALKHFQDAYKLNPALIEALEEARLIYWDLGKTGMVQKLLELELKSMQDGHKTALLLVELGDVYADQGEIEKAAQTYARALAAAKGKNSEASACLEDVQVTDSSWQDRVGQLLRTAHEAPDPSSRARLFVRAARIARRFAPEAMEGMLAQAYAADPADRAAAALYENLLVEAQRTNAILEQQRQVLAGIADTAKRGDAALRFGTRWVTRHQNLEAGVELLQEAFAADPSNEAAFTFLREIWGTKEGNWERVVELLDRATQSRNTNGSETFILAQAATLTWRQLGNMMRARGYFERLSAISPDHPSLKAFEKQIGEAIKPRADGGKQATPAKQAPPPAKVAPVEPVRAPIASDPGVSTPKPAAAAVMPSPVPAKPAAGPADEGKIAELRAAAEKQESAKRYNEFVRTLMQLAGMVSDKEERVELYQRAADLYVTKFANQAEAVKAYEAILDIDAENAKAIDFLRQMYEKRRDWEKLLGLQRRSAERLEPGPERAARFLEIARLATERVKKPDVCIDLWREVLESDSENAEALNNLAGLYERAKDYAALASVLEKQSEATHDTAQRIVILGKLAAIYGDRLENDEGAVAAWRTLLTLDPNDRKAQEALKKKYLALGRWDDLEVFYSESGKWDEFIRVLETQESRETDKAAKIGLLMKIAELWGDKKKKDDRAAKSYERVLELDPEHLAAAEALIPIYRQGNNFRGLASGYEVKLRHETDAGPKLELYRELAGIYETRLKDAAKAFERYLLAFEIAPSDEQCAEDLERAAKAAGRWEDVIKAYQAAVTKSKRDGEESVAITLRLRLGRVLVDELGRVDLALTEFRTVYESDRENVAALGALERLYRQTSRFDELLEIYEKKRELAVDAADRREILYSIARLYEGEMKNPKKAIASYTAVLDDEPADPVALKALDVLYRDLKDYEAYADILRRRIELDLAESELIDLKFRLGRTLELHLKDAASALDNYREILFLDPGHEGAREALESLLDHVDLRSQAAAILESIYDVRGEWQKLVRVLQILAQSEGDVARRVALQRKVGRIAVDALGDVNLAFEAQAKALKDDPSITESRVELERLAAEANAWDRLEAVFDEIAAGLADAALARDYWMRLAHIDERLGKVDEAAKGYAHILSQNPADSEALEALDSLYRRTERYSDLIGVFRRRIELSNDAPSREALYAQMAEVYEEKLRSPEDAIAAYKEVLALDDTSKVALSALDALYTRQKMWVELADNLEAQLRLAESEDAELDLMLRLATLRERDMGQMQEAIEGYRQVLERDSGNANALAALERLGQSSDYELAIAEILEPLYRQSGNFQKLIGVHEVQVRNANDALRKVELLHQVATLYSDAAGDLNAAFETLARALREDPSSDSTQQGLERLARSTSRLPDLARVFEELAAEQQDPHIGSALYATAARVYQNDLHDVESAIRHFQKVLTIDATNLAAAESLETLFRSTNRYAELSQVLQRKSEMLDTPEEKKEALYQAALIEEEVLERREDAVKVYLKILEGDPEDLRSVDALVKLYLGLSRWEDLLNVYTTKADLVADVDEKKRIFYQVGAVFEHELGKVDKAIDTYERVLELDPDDLTALGRLDVLYQTAQNWPELLNVLTHEAELCQDADESISYQYRIAELYETRLDDVPRALELYREILARESSHAPTLKAIEGLKAGDRDPLTAASVLEPVYEASGDWPKLIGVLEVQARFAEDPMNKVDILHRVARLYVESLRDPLAAFDVYARALQVDNGNEETLAALERLGGLGDRWPQVAKLYDVELDKLGDEPARLVDLGLRTAQIYEVQLEDIDSAVARYRQVLAADPENLAAVSALDRLFTRTERWADLAQVLAREAEIGQTPDEILEFKFRLGQVYESRLGDLDSAISAYRDVLAAAPEHAPTLEAIERLFAAGTKQAEIAEVLEPLYQAAADWDKLQRVYEAQLGHIEDPADRLAMFYRMAELAEEKLLDVAAAMAVYARAMKEVPLDEKTGEEIERLAGSVDGGWESLANGYADVLGLHVDPDVQRVVGGRLARTFEEELGDITKAEETYRYVLGVQPLDPDALANLDRIYTSLEQWGDLAQVLEQRVKATTEPHELVELYARLGETYEEKLGQVDDAVRAYRQIFDGLDKTHEGSIQALSRIYEQKQAWHELNTVYERELENASGDVQEAEIRAKIAHLASDRLDNPSRAITTWKRVLDLRGEDPESLGALANLYESAGQWAELCDILEREFDIADSDELRVNVLNRRARIFLEQLGRDEQALSDYNRVLDLDYANVDALRAIAAIWRKRKDPNELVSALHAIVDRASSVLDAEELKATYRELGRTYDDPLAQQFEASDAWRKLLEIDPGDFGAIDALDVIYRAGAQWQDVVAVKMQRADALTDPEAQTRELLEVAKIWDEELHDKDGGTKAYEKILALNPAHDHAYTTLEQLHTAASRWEPLIELYLQRLDTREETSEKTDILRRIARVFEEKLDDKGQAFDALVNAFSEDYSDRETARYLERMAQATGRWGEVIQSANTWLQGETDPAQRIRLCLRLAKWYGEDLGHPEYAQPYYAQIVQLDPNNVSVLRQMGSLYRKNAQWQQYGQTLTRALDVATTDLDRKEILTDLGDLLERQMNDVDQGLGYYTRALEIDALHLPALEALERIYTTRAMNRELVDVLGRKVKALTEGEAIAAHKLRIASLYDGTLGDVDRAAQTYREVLDIDAGSLPAMRGLEKIYTQKSSWPELVGVLEQQLDVVTSERERIELLMKLATIQEEQFLKPDLAALRLEQVVEIDASHEAALIALERCYRRLKQWIDLITTYDKHIAMTVERQVKVDLYGAMAQVYAEEVEDLDRSIDAYRNIVDIDESNVPALEALSKLFEKQGEAAQAIDYMTRVADLTADGKQRVEMYYRIGKALDEKLGERAQAQERYEMALDLDPSHLPTLGALRQIAIDQAEWDRAARYLDQEQLNTQSARQRAKLLVELGRLRDETLGEHDLGIQAYELALQCDNDNEEAAFPLVSEYVAKQRWAEAEPLAELLIKKGGKRDRREQHSLYNMLGAIASALGKDDKALKAYQDAHKLDLTDSETIKGLADVCFRLRDWAGALSNYQKVLTSLDEADVDARANVYFKLGAIKKEQGQAKQAINNFEKALAVKTHRPSLEALIDVYTGLKDFKQVCAYKRQILDDVDDVGERFKLLVEIGDTWADKEKNPLKAIETYEEALELEPKNHVLLHKLLQLYQATSNWPKMIESLQTIAALETNPERKSKYIYTMAQLYRDKEEDLDRAVEAFNETLDLNPSFLEAFERINKILTQKKDWKQLERAFRKMLHRISGKGNVDLEYNLWHNLGLIYRDRINDLSLAIEAFKMAARLKAEEAVERQILAELYETTDQIDLAVEEQLEILRRDPLRVDPYRALYRLSVRQQQYDAAWCMCQALSFLGKADEDETKFFEDYRAKGMLQVKSRLDNELWVKNLFHPDENLYIGKIFEMLAAAALLAKIQQLKATKQLPNLDKRFKQDPATSTVTFAKTFGWAAQVLAVPCPELYVRNDVPGTLAAVPIAPPASVAGQSVLTGFTPQDLTFIIGKHLSYYRGEHYIKHLFPTVAELTMLLFAGMKMVQPDTPVPGEMVAQVNATAAELAKFMQPIHIEGLRLVVRKFMEDGAKANIKRFSQCVELTACRAGLLLCGDLEIARKIIAAEPQVPGDLPPQDKLKELVIFSVSKQYLGLRKALGIAIG
ncbi:MAG TPA: tetratricopeptide repeat protein [Polyangiaceae bacterium]|nr:tetratricopeptide repeat protein [Polyangiaceae bacterium]